MGVTQASPDIALSQLLDTEFGATAGITIMRNSTNWTAVPFNAGAGGGTVTTMAIASANGFAGVVTNPTTTPSVAISTSVVGIVKGNGTALSAAVANTDYQAPLTVTTTGTSGAATISGSTLNIPQYSSSTSPGGTSGQIQVNSSGSFGGVTASGDATISSSGVVTVTKTSGVAFAASATTDTTNAGNIANGTLAVARLPTTGLTVTQSKAAINVVADAATINFDCSVSNFHQATIGGNRTLTISNLATGQKVEIKVQQAASGGPYTPTWSVSGISWNNTATMPTTASAWMTVILEGVSSGVVHGWWTGNSDGSGGASGASVPQTVNSGAMDFSTGNWFLRTLNGSNGTITAANVVVGSRVRIELAQDATGTHTVTWSIPGAIYVGGSPPTQTSTALAVDIYEVECPSTGVVYIYAIKQNLLPSTRTFTHVQGNKNNGSTTSTSVTLTGVTAGNLLAVGVVNNAFRPPFTASDGTNTYTTAVSKNDTVSGGGQLLWTQASASGSLTITVSTPGGYCAVTVDEFHPSIAGAFSVDNANAGAGASGAASAGNVTISGNDSMVVSILEPDNPGIGGGGSNTPSSGYTLSQAIPTPSSGSIGISSAYKLNVSTGPETPGWTLPDNNAWTVCAASFK